MIVDGIDPASILCGRLVKILMEEEDRLIGVVLIAVTSEGVETAACGRIQITKVALAKCKQSIINYSEQLSAAINAELDKEDKPS